MIKNKFNRLLKNNVHIILSISIFVATIIATNYYTLYKKNQEKQLLNFSENIYLKKTINSLIENLNPRYSFKNFKIKKGDTFEKILSQLSIPKSEKEIIISKRIILLILMI